MKSIRRRLTLYLLATVSVLLAAGGAGVFLSTRAVLLVDFDEVLRKVLPEVLGTVREHLVNRPGPGDPVQFEFRNPSIYVQVWTPEGALIGRSVNLRGQDLRLSPAPAGILDLTLPNGNRGRAFTSVQPMFSAKPGASFREERERLLTKVPKSLVVTVAADRRELDGALRRLSRVLWTVGGLMIGLTGGVAAFVSRRGLAPLNVVAEQAGRIDASTLDFRFPMESLPAELKSICGRLNDLLSRLETAFARERCFSADVAHELRTPIAELRSLADVALKWPSADPAVVASGSRKPWILPCRCKGLLMGCWQSLVVRLALRRSPGSRWRRPKLSEMPGNLSKPVPLRSI
jgi:signal transduction histidine kinase